MFQGPLRKCEKNPRYFTDDSGEAIYLTGAHTWPVNQNAISEDPSVPSIIFDFEAYLQKMQRYNHNFLRFWTQEGSLGMGPRDHRYLNDPMPYIKVGKNEDGMPVYDLTKLNDAYFEHVRKKCILGQKYGVYMSIMLFEAWSVDTRGRYCWDAHPYNIKNNINGIDGNPPYTGTVALSGENDKNPFKPDEHIILQTLENPQITRLQKAYVKRMIETVNDLDNIMYEICNEGFRWTRFWQYEMIDFIHETEKSMPKQHPVWMSHLVPAQNESLWISNADAISPGVESTADDYCIDPPAGSGEKVIFADTDHLGGIWGTREWAWKSFLRGLNPIFMDDIGAKHSDITDESLGGEKKDESAVSMLFGRYQYGLPSDWEEPVRVAVGRTRTWAQRINLTEMIPYSWVSSTGYCLAKLGEEYLVLQPESGQFKMNLYGADATFDVEWYRIETNEIIPGKPFSCASAIDFTPPVPGQVLLHLKKKS